MAVGEIITIVCDGYALKGFQSIEIERSMQDGAMSFSLEASAASWSPQAMALRNGTAMQIYAAPVGSAGMGDLIATGAIDHYESDISEDGRTVNLTGRTKGRDAIDCHPVKHPTGVVQNKTLLGAAQVFDEFGTNWSTDQPLPTLPLVQRRPEEPLFETIERYARRGGFMLVGQPDGGIMITRAGSKRHAGALVLGQSPVNGMRVALSPTQKRSPVVVRGQRRSGTGQTNLRQEYQDQGDDGDAYRPLLIIAEGDHSDQDLQTRARWERLRRAGYGTRITPRVSVWRDAAGLLWTPGYLMAIVNEVEGIDGDFTLSTAKLVQKDGEGKGAGTRAILEFVDPAAHGGTSTTSGSSDSVFSSGGGL